MGRPLSFTEGVRRHPEIPAPPVSTRFWQQRFQPSPPRSLEALLIKLGPFKPPRDAFWFNNDFILTSDQIDQVRQHYRTFVDLAIGASPLELVRDALKKLGVDVFGHRVGLPDYIIDIVLGNLGVLLVEFLTDSLVLSFIDTFGSGDGRCGGMAFSGYDFYLLDWTVDQRLGIVPPSEGVLGDYIFGRLLDSIDSNGLKFLEWFTILHLLGTNRFRSAAKDALIAAVAILGGPIGDLFASLIAVVDVFSDLGGPKSLLKKSKDEWPKIKEQLDSQAACPVGLLFRGSTTPFGDHQILALDYEDDASGTLLKVWDNRDLPPDPDPKKGLTQGPNQRILQIDFNSDVLEVDPGSDWQGGVIAGIFLENYSPHRPPDSLHFTGNAGP
jgi:hypothetical protein